MKKLSLKALTLAATILAVPAWAETVTIALSVEPTTLDPLVADDGFEKIVNVNLFETLINRDAAGNLTLGVAADWPVQVDDSTWRVTIKDGIKFHNGEDLDAEAVAFSTNLVLDPEFNSEQVGFFESMVSASAVDRLTVEFKTNGADAILPTRLYYLSIVPPVASQQDGFGSNPVGSGPYKFVSWDRGSSIVLEANDDYHGGRPGIDEAMFRVIQDDGTRAASLLAGEVDLTTNLAPEFLKRVPQHLSTRSVEHMVAVLNHLDGATADPRVRLAMNLAVDKVAIAEALYGGLAIPDAGQLLGPTYFGFNEALSPFPYDPEQAKALIKEAGAEGAKIEFVSTSGRWLKGRELTEVVGAYWSAVGLDVDIQIYEFGEFVNRIYDKGSRTEAIFVGSGNEFFDADRAFTGYYAPSGFAASHDIQKLEELVVAARSEMDPEKRLALYHEATVLANEEALMVWLVNLPNIWGASERLLWEPRVDAKLDVQSMSFK